MVMSILQCLQFLYRVSVIKTIIFNFNYFHFNIAIRIPAIIYKNVELYNLKGNIILSGHIKTGILEIGNRNVSIFPKNVKFVWDVNGTLIIKGKCCLGSGSSLSVAEGARLEIGDNFSITAHSTIDCSNHIIIGKDCLLSWDILIMDSDYHKIMDTDNNQINPDSSICIGDHVWIGCRCLILKGVSVADNTVISANTTLTKNVSSCDCVVGNEGKQQKILKTKINWVM